jgi:hypothetical protein
MGHSSSAAALRYQHVMAGRDAAIAAALDELVRAASTKSEGGVRRGEWHAGGTNRATRRRRSVDDRLGGRDLLGWWVGLPGLEPGTSSLSEIDGCAPCYPAFLQLALIHERHRDGVNHAGPYQLAAAIYWRPMGSQLELKRSILAASEP